MTEQIDVYSHMWSEPGWWLWQSPSGAYLPMSEVDGVTYATIIESDDLATAVAQRMIESGVPIRN